MKVSKEELLKHNSTESLWLSINNHVWDLTEFLKTHPGTDKPLLHYASTGGDGTEGFNKVHPNVKIEEILDSSKYIGTLEL